MRHSKLLLATWAFPLVWVLAVAAGRPSPAAAEEAGPPQAAELIRLRVREGHEGEMERFLARLAEGARRTGDPVRWRVYRRVDGDHPLYVLVLRARSAEQITAWNGLTASTILERAYGAEEARSILALREASLESLQRERFVAEPGLSFDD